MELGGETSKANSSPSSRNSIPYWKAAIKPFVESTASTIPVFETESTSPAHVFEIPEYLKLEGTHKDHQAHLPYAFTDVRGRRKG